MTAETAFNVIQHVDSGQLPELYKLMRVQPINKPKKQLKKPVISQAQVVEKLTIKLKRQNEKYKRNTGK